MVNKWVILSAFFVLENWIWLKHFIFMNETKIMKPIKTDNRGIEYEILIEWSEFNQSLCTHITVKLFV
jgi:hypothetical protein